MRLGRGNINDGKFPSLSSRCNRQTLTNKRRQVVVLPTNHGLRRAREEYYFHPRVMRRPTCVYRDPSIPASSQPAHLDLFFQDSTPLPLPRGLLSSPSPLLPGPARRWYRTHAITKADMRSNDARDEEHSVNITLRDEVPRLIGSTSGNMRWIPLINSNLLLAHPTHQPPPYQIQAKTSSPLAWPLPIQNAVQAPGTGYPCSYNKQADFQTTTGQRNTPSSANYASIRFSSSPPVSLVSLLDDLFSLALRSASAAVRW